MPRFLVRPVILPVVVLAITACGRPAASVSPSTTPDASSTPPSPSASPSEQPAEASCPEGDATLASVIAVAASQRPDCFDDEVLTLRGWTWDDQGVYDCQNLGSAPSWLACSVDHVRLTTLAYPAGDPTAAMIDPADGPLRVAVDSTTAAADALRPNRWVELQGRFNDPVTSACDELWEGFREECLSTFVVSGARVLNAPGILPPDAWAVVTRDDLRVRGEPRLSSQPFDMLAAGDRVFVGIGPFPVDGQWWYGVNYGTDYATARQAGWPRFGFVAAGEAESPFLEPASFTCADLGTGLEAILARPAHERAECFGGGDITLDAYLMPPELGPDGTCVFMGEIPPWEPRWLTLGCGALQADDYPLSVDQLALHADPAVSAAMVAAGEGPARVVGHFNDPVADSCEDGSRPPVLWGVFYPPTDDGALVLRCRASFVVTEVVPIGR